MSANLACQRCGQLFWAQRSDAKWCPVCRPVVRRRTFIQFENRHRTSCQDCGNSVVRRAARCKTCNARHHSEQSKGNKNPNWREGRSRSGGYITVRIKAGSPGKGKGAFYRGEHIVVWERTYGKPLPKGWVVHHLNGVKDDNRPENLLGTPRHRHHQHPREALRPYERRIKYLEDQLAALQRLKLPEPTTV